jgi:hypothetical protein
MFDNSDKLLDFSVEIFGRLVRHDEPFGFDVGRLHPVLVPIMYLYRGFSLVLFLNLGNIHWPGSPPVLDAPGVASLCTFEGS